MFVRLSVHVLIRRLLEFKSRGRFDVAFPSVSRCVILKKRMK